MTDHDTGDDDGLDRLPELIQDAVANCLCRALARHPRKAEAVRAAFRDLAKLDHAALYSLVGPQEHPAVVAGLLDRGGAVQRQYGRSLWHSDRLDQDTKAVLEDNMLPRPRGTPRVFVAHAWADDDEPDILVEEFASGLFNNGYDIVYDRDPRFVALGFSSDEVLTLLPGCTRFVAMVTANYQSRILDGRRRSPVCQEFAWATSLFRKHGRPRPLGIWLDGKELLPPFSADWVIDCRKLDAFHAVQRIVFPRRSFEAVAILPDGTERRTGPIPRERLRSAIVELVGKGGTGRLRIEDVTPARAGEDADDG